MIPLTLSQLVYDNISSVGCVVAGLVAAIVVVTKLSDRPNLDAFPAIGSSSWLGSWWDGIKYLTNAEKIIQAGYDKYKDTPFKVATPFQWLVIFSSRNHTEELRNASDDIFSLLDAVNEDFNLDYLMEHGRSISHNPFHVQVIRTQLTKNLNVLFPEIFDEVSTAFDEVLALKQNEWKSMPVLKTAQEVICRTSNRVFRSARRSHIHVPSLPGRNKDYIADNIQWATNAFPAGIAIGFLPKFMKRSAVRYLTKIHASTDRAVNHLRLLIEERRKCPEKYGHESADKPNDFLAWLMDVQDEAPEHLASRVTIMNLASIYSASIIFTGALFMLAAHPEYIQPLREEVETLVEKEGWCKESVNQMYKVDSFLREFMRVQGISVLGISRKVMKDYTFSDGLLIPKGTRIALSAQALHSDDAHYPNAAVFDPFRFSDMREGDEDGVKNQFTTTSCEYLPFGYGKHSCPGRFFASNELKTMLAYVVLTYDIKLDGDAPRPLCFGTLKGAHPTAELMFRKRVNLK